MPQESAAFIRMDATIADNLIIENSTNVSILLHNTGDEIAYDIKLYLARSDNFYSEKNLSCKLLYSGDEALEYIPIKVYKNISLGIYPIVFMLEYKDANGYQFSTVITSLIKYKKGPESKIEGAIYPSDVNEDGSGTYTLSISNFDDTSHDVTIKLYMPKNFYSSFSQCTLPLDSISYHKINFNITNINALPNSNYPIYAFIEYDFNSFHYSSIATGTVTVGKEKEKQPIWAYLTAIFVVLLLIYLYYKKREKKWKFL